MALELYNKKRDFEKTPEPPGEAKATGGHGFVIQHHRASRDHYDFRLELDGVLKSWAVPKGPSLDPQEKRLAVHVEDHPVDYGDFEGVIPEGEYGGGTVLLWDRGEWHPEGDAAEAYRKGRLSFQLEGHKLHGGWSLVRMKGRANERGPENWLLIKKNDQYSASGTDGDVTGRLPASVTSNRTLDEIASAQDRVWHSNRSASEGGARPRGVRARIADRIRARKAGRAKPDAGGAEPAEPAPAPGSRSAKSPARVEAPSAARAKAPARAGGPAPRSAKSSRRTAAIDLSKEPGAARAPFPGAVAPALATLVDRPPSDDGFFFELKLDGYRAMCLFDGKKAKFISRNGNDWTGPMTALAKAASTLAGKRAVLDGEVVVSGADGTTDFQDLQNAFGSDRQADLRYFVFDLLYLDGYDLRAVPLVRRKAILAQLLSGRGASDPIRYLEHVEGSGDKIFAEACRLKAEGIIAKRRDSPYASKRTRDWLKIKCAQRQELVIGGYTDPAGSRAGLGALLLAVQDGGRLVYAGRVGTGFSAQSLRELKARLAPLERDTPPFAKAPARKRGVHWVEPNLVAEVSFSNWTSDGLLRHPSFHGLREDRDPKEVVREVAQPVARAKPAPKAKLEEVRVADVKLTNPDRVLYPESGITKRALAEYYAENAERILPQVIDRPLMLLRCPEGWQAERWYQKHETKGMPEAIRKIDVEDGKKHQPSLYIDSVQGLVSLVQMGVLEIHIWGTRIDRIERPDRLVFDLDPHEEVGWERVLEAANTVKTRLTELGLESFAMISGGKGIHVVLPIARTSDWDLSHALTRAVADRIVREDPRHFVATMSKAQRGGKIFIDHFRNARGATAIAPYSTRARANAPVATPVTWKELGELEAPDAFDFASAKARFAKLRKDPWQGYESLKQTIKPDRLETFLKSATRRTA